MVTCSQPGHTLFSTFNLLSVVLKVSARLGVSASPGSLLEMQILGPYSRPTESETLGVMSINLCFNKSSRCKPKFGNDFLITYLDWKSLSPLPVPGLWAFIFCHIGIKGGRK